MGKAEDLVGFIGQELVFGVGELTVGVFGLEGGDDGGAGVGEFVGIDGFVAGAGQGVNEAGKGLGIAAEALVEIALIEVTEGEEGAGNGELEGGLVEARGVEVFEEAESGFLLGAEGIEPVLVQEPLFVVGAGVPAGDVAGGDRFAGFAEPGGDVGEGDAVEDQEVEGFAGGEREAADFAFGAVGRRGGRVWRRRAGLPGSGWTGLSGVVRGRWSWGRQELERRDGRRVIGGNGLVWGLRAGGVHISVLNMFVDGDPVFWRGRRKKIYDRP